MAGAPAWETEFGSEGGLYRRLRADCASDWDAYTWHPFVRGIAEGTLPLAAFRRYLIQDYLFLIHFARGKALGVFKAESVAAMRDKAAGITATLSETLMHLRYCEGWGISQAEVLATPEAAETVSYTRYVIDRGMAGDILDLEVAMAPCTVGYGEVALRVEAHPQRRRDGNPYESWIATYADPGYQALAKSAAARIDALGVSHGGEARFPILSGVFSEATRLEARFWQQGLDAARRGATPDYEKAHR